MFKFYTYNRYIIRSVGKGSSDIWVDEMCTYYFK